MGFKNAYGGTQVKELLETGYTLVNGSCKVKGGPFTRYDPSEPENDIKKSVLSLCIVSNELFEFVDSLIIDKEKKFTPYRVLSSSRVVFTDHYSLLLKFKNLPTVNAKKTSKPETIWNTKKDGGWVTYEQLTTENEVLEKVPSMSNTDPNAIEKVISKEMQSVKYKSFGKVTVNKSAKPKRNSAAADGVLTEEPMSSNKSLLSKQSDIFTNKVKNLKETWNVKGKAAAVFQLRDDILGAKTPSTEPSVVTDPLSGLKLYSSEDIRRVSLTYCKNLLTNREAIGSFKDDLAVKDFLHEFHMKEIVENDCNDLSREQFISTIEALAKKKSSKYEFILKSGPSFKEALFHLCQAVWYTEKIPLSWHKSTLIQIYKGKGDRTILDNIRHIHIKDEIPKVFGHLVMSAAKDKLFANMSKYQIGAKAGHRPQERLFVLKSIIALNLQNNKSFFLSLYDISKFFDRESLRDCLNEVHKYGVQGKLYRLLYGMNENTRISVQTPVGTSDECDTGETVGQGTLEGAVVSAVSLDKGVQEFFCDSEFEVAYVGLRLQPLLFQDDISRLADDPISVQAGNDKLEVMAETKLLDFNCSKSCYLHIGKMKHKRVFQEQLLRQPITLCGNEMSCVPEAKLLGDWISDQGLSKSAEVTVRKRKGMAIASIYEIRTVVEDCRSNILGGLSTGLDLWESAVVPMLLFNSETWTSISSSTLETLENIQKRFYRCLLAVGSGCPIPSLYWETGGTLMKYRILQRKLLLLHHIATLSDSCLAKEVYNLQKELNLPGLVSECSNVLRENDIYDIAMYSKYQWKKIAKSITCKLNKDELIRMSKKYKKIDYSWDDNLTTRHSYLNGMKVNDARMLFKIRSKMAPTIQMNFPSDKTYAANKWICSACLINLDTQDHVINCEEYSKYREGLNLDEDEDLVKYFQSIVNLRSGQTIIQ